MSANIPNGGNKIDNTSLKKVFNDYESEKEFKQEMYEIENNRSRAWVVPVLIVIGVFVLLGVLYLMGY